MTDPTTETRQQISETTFGQKVIFGQKSQSGLDTLTY
jgi:hypothetical protein